jgi:hypothetical protein
VTSALAGRPALLYNDIVKLVPLAGCERTVLRSGLLALAALLVGLLASTACRSGAAPPITDSETRHFPVGDNPSLSLDLDGGSIDVRAGAGAEIRVTLRKSAPSRAVLRSIATRWTQEGDSVSVRVSHPRRWLGRSGTTEAELVVPRRTALELNTGRGSIGVGGLESGLRARTGGGSLVVAATSGDLDLSTGGGGIEISGLSGQVRARTGGGSIVASGEFRGDSRLETGGGSITVELRDEARLRIEARGTKVTSELDIAGQTAPGYLKGVLGDGSRGSLELQTGGGSVRLRRYSQSRAGGHRRPSVRTQSDHAPTAAS